MNYKDKICVITGAASGIGYATTKLLKEMEAKIYALDVNKVDIEGIEFIETNLNNKESIDNAFNIIPKHIDCFFGVAGVSGVKTNYYDTFTINYISNKYITETYLKNRMSIGGAITYVTSVAGSYWDKYAKEYFAFTKAKTWEEMQEALHNQANPDTIGMMAYPLSKRAMNHYTSEMAITLGEKGIRVNALLPASTATGMKEEFERAAGGEDALLSQTGIARRLATSEEMAKPLIFLNSDWASYISGTMLTVDYGNDALIKLGMKKDRLDVKVGSKIYNMGFFQNILKKQLEQVEVKEEKDLTEEVIPYNEEISTVTAEEIFIENDKNDTTNLDEGLSKEDVQNDILIPYNDEISTVVDEDLMPYNDSISTIMKEGTNEAN